MIHKTTLNAEEYASMVRKRNTFEIRSSERTYRPGDTLVYREFVGLDFTGREFKKRVTHVTAEHEGLKEGYVILSIERVKRTARRKKKK